MAIELRTFASGDTDYISKMNANVAMEQAALNAIQTLLGGLTGDDTAGAFLYALFKNTTTLIGPTSYLPAISGTNLIVAGGGAFYTTTGAAVFSLTTQTLAFFGQPAGTYYINLNGAGGVTRSTTPSEPLYSVVWSGSVLSAVTRVAPALLDAVESEASRISAALATTYNTLDARLEAGEAISVQAAADATNALALAYEGLAGTGRIRKVGLSLDGGGAVITTGVKGAIQIDFAGTIIGWSLMADQVGDITVEVDRQASSPPPAAPGIPDTTTDKISASAPIALAAVQSSAAVEAGVSTWTTALAEWDVIQFNVTAVTTITRATLYLRIQET